jgi:hypothetical protein
MLFGLCSDHRTNRTTNLHLLIAPTAIQCLAGPAGARVGFLEMSSSQEPILALVGYEDVRSKEARKVCPNELRYAS